MKRTGKLDNLLDNKHEIDNKKENVVFNVTIRDKFYWVIGVFNQASA